MVLTLLSPQISDPASVTFLWTINHVRNPRSNARETQVEAAPIFFPPPLAEFRVNLSHGSSTSDVLCISISFTKILTIHINKGSVYQGLVLIRYKSMIQFLRTSVLRNCTCPSTIPQQSLMQNSSYYYNVFLNSLHRKKKVPLTFMDILPTNISHKMPQNKLFQ